MSKRNFGDLYAGLYEGFNTTDSKVPKYVDLNGFSTFYPDSVKQGFDGGMKRDGHFIQMEVTSSKTCMDYDIFGDKRKLASHIKDGDIIFSLIGSTEANKDLEPNEIVGLNLPQLQLFLNHCSSRHLEHKKKAHGADILLTDEDYYKYEISKNLKNDKEKYELYIKDFDKEKLDYLNENGSLYYNFVHPELLKRSVKLMGVISAFTNESNSMNSSSYFNNNEVRDENIGVSINTKCVVNRGRLIITKNIFGFDNQDQNGIEKFEPKMSEKVFINFKPVKYGYKEKNVGYYTTTFQITFKSTYSRVMYDSYYTFDIKTKDTSEYFRLDEVNLFLGTVHDSNYQFDGEFPLKMKKKDKGADDEDYIEYLSYKESMDNIKTCGELNLYIGY